MLGGPSNLGPSPPCLLGLCTQGLEQQAQELAHPVKGSPPPSAICSNPGEGGPSGTAAGTGRATGWGMAGLVKVTMFPNCAQPLPLLEHADG